MTSYPRELFEEPPRKWQEEAFGVLMPIIRSRRNVVLQACTGAGKTYLQLAIIWTILQTMRPGYCIVISVPRMGLVDQTYADACRAIGAQNVGRWYGRRKEENRVIIACHNSVPLLVDHLNANRVKIAFWLADECHQASADGMIDAMRAAAPWCRLGVTATPFPSSGHPALRGWDEIAYKYTIDQATADGVLVPLRSVMSPRADEDVNQITIEMIQRYAPPGPGLVSATDIIDAEWYAEMLTEAGIPALAVHCKLKPAELASRLRRLAEGKLRCVVHIDLLTEGRDLPDLRWLAARAPRGSARAIVQEVGRLLRPLKPSSPSLAYAGPKREAVLLMPRYVPYGESASREGTITASMDAIDLERAAQRELAGVPREKLLPLSEAAEQVADYVIALIDQAREEGVDVPDPYDDGGLNAWRPLVPSGKQIENLKGLTSEPRKGAIKFLPEQARDLMYAVVQRPGNLTQGQMHDLLRLLSAVRLHGINFASRFRHMPPNRRFWKGMMSSKAVAPETALKAFKKGET